MEFGQSDPLARAYLMHAAFALLDIAAGHNVQVHTPIRCLKSLVIQLLAACRACPSQQVGMRLLIQQARRTANDSAE